MITEDYVSFEVAKLLKEKGFDEDITTYRDDFIKRGNIVISLQECISKDKIKTPTIQMALKHLRKTYKVHFEVPYRANRYEVFIMTIEELPKCICRGITGKTYEEAVEKALKYYLTNQI